MSNKDIKEAIDRTVAAANLVLKYRELSSVAPTVSLYKDGMRTAMAQLLLAQGALAKLSKVS